MSCVCECHGNPHPPVTMGLTSSPSTSIPNLAAAILTSLSSQGPPPPVAIPTLLHAANPPAPVTSPGTSRPPADIDQLDGVTRSPTTTVKKVQNQQFIEQLDGTTKPTTPLKKSAAHQTNPPAAVSDHSSVEANSSKDGAKRVMEDDVDFKISTKRFRTPTAADNVSYQSRIL